MLPIDNLINLAESFLYQAQPDSTQWNDSAAHAFAVELQEICHELGVLRQVVTAIQVTELAIGL
jgi:hypothetical protein